MFFILFFGLIGINLLFFFVGEVLVGIRKIENKVGVGWEVRSGCCNKESRLEGKSYILKGILEVWVGIRVLDLRKF